MRYIFNFPDIGEGLDEGTIAEWYVVKGQELRSGDPLLKMETDKVVTDIPSPKSGTIVAIYGKVGEVVKVGEPLVEIEMEGTASDTGTTVEAVNEEGAGVVGTLEVAGNQAYLPASAEGIQETKPSSGKPMRKALATPVARSMAREMKVDIDRVPGTGPGGRVTIEDVKKYADSSKSLFDQQKDILIRGEDRITIEPLSQLRRTIARNMIHAKQNAAHMTVHEEVEIEALADVVQRYKPVFLEKGVKLSYLPFVLKATAMALKKHRSLNSQIDMEKNQMIYKNYYNIGIAVDTENGLLVPVVHDADKLSIFMIAGKVNEIAAKARERKLTMDDMKDGTFTITNYGSIGGIFAVPVINYPQAGILGIGRIHEKPVIRDGNIVKGTVMPLSLSVDHRIVDGGEVTRFINDLMHYLSDPVALIME